MNLFGMYKKLAILLGTLLCVIFVLQVLQVKHLDFQCNCKRSERSYTVTINQEQSSCDYYSTARGNHQNVVSYSFFGNTSSIYFQGVEPSIINVAHSYPGWVMRLYHNINTSNPVENAKICKLWCKYHHLDVCDAHSLPNPLGDQSKVFGMLWRFFPLAGNINLGDRLVERLIVRDLDGPIIQREVDAVNDWIQSNKTFHIMKDHPYHYLHILGGMWGATNFNTTLTERLRAEFISKGTIWHYSQDQTLLARIIYPIAIKDSVIHDSYSCNNRTRPFPTRRINSTYVGMYYEWLRNVAKLRIPCPIECRPVEHKDWELC